MRKILLVLLVALMILVGCVNACGYGKYQRDCPVVITPPIDATKYDARHMSFIDVSVIDGIEDMENAYLMYSECESRFEK